jgi:hypothetical protein
VRPTDFPFVSLYREIVLRQQDFQPADRFRNQLTYPFAEPVQQNPEAAEYRDHVSHD